MEFSKLPLDIFPLILAEADWEDEKRVAGAVALTCRALRDEGQRVVYQNLSPGGRHWAYESSATRAVLHDERLAAFVRTVAWGFLPSALQDQPGGPDYEQRSKCSWRMLDAVLARCANVDEVHLLDIPPTAWRTVFSGLLQSPSRRRLRALSLAAAHDFEAPQNSQVGRPAEDLVFLLRRLPSLRQLSANFVSPPTSTSSSLWDHSSVAVRETPVRLQSLRLYRPGMQDPLYFPDDDSLLPPLLSSLDRPSLRDFTIFHFPGSTVLPTFLAQPDLHLRSLAVDAGSSVSRRLLALFGLELNVVDAAKEVSALLPYHPNLEHFSLYLPNPPPSPSSSPAAAAALEPLLAALPLSLRTLSLDFLITPSSPIMRDFLGRPERSGILCFVAKREGPGGRAFGKVFWDKAADSGEWNERLGNDW
ncbi:hypothetical protein JCM6882_002936 [Rhodosporidiobolus microsporus]